MIHIIKERPIKEYMDDNPSAKLRLQAWISIIKGCEWKKPQDIVEEFGPKAIDLLGKKDTKPGTISSKRVVFDIKGNYIRIIAKYQFHLKLKKTRLYIKWIGTHSEYDKLCEKNLQYDIDIFE